MLEPFGFTPTESKSYQALLRIGPSTGYAVALELGIARANVYQALESLVRRGAARKSATAPSRFAAVAPALLTAELERGFRREIHALDEALRRAPQASETDAGGLELLTTADGLLERAVEAADGVTKELLVVTGPWAAALSPALGRATERGAAVRSVALGEPSPEGAVVRRVPENELRSYWGGLPVAVVADRSRAVFGVLTSGRHASGVVSDAPGVVPFLRHLLRREITGGA
jgi:sugar-specific transcriptional regulator TrmB